MPKIVDHEARRRHLADVVVRHVAEHGFEATTYARIAAEAGVSVGTIQHYFDSRAELLTHAYGELLRARDARVRAEDVAGDEARLPIRAVLVDVLHQLLPLDEVRRREHRVVQRLRVEAAHDPHVAALVDAADRDVIARVAAAVDRGRECGEVADATGTEAGARRIVAVTDGLAQQLAREPDPADVDVDGVLAPVVTGVFSGRCRRYEPA